MVKIVQLYPQCWFLWYSDAHMYVWFTFSFMYVELDTSLSKCLSKCSLFQSHIWFKLYLLYPKIIWSNIESTLVANLLIGSKTLTYLVKSGFKVLRQTFFKIFLDLRSLDFYPSYAQTSEKRESQIVWQRTRKLSKLHCAHGANTAIFFSWLCPVLG